MDNEIKDWGDNTNFRSFLFVFGAIGVLTNSLPQNILWIMGVLALIFIGAGISLKKRVKK